MAAPTELVTTGTAARVLGIDRSTLTRWALAGAVTPASRTVGGHMRWNLDALRHQIEELASTGRTSSGQPAGEDVP